MCLILTTNVWNISAATEAKIREKEKTKVLQQHEDFATDFLFFFLRFLPRGCQNSAKNRRFIFAKRHKNADLQKWNSDFWQNSDTHGAEISKKKKQIGCEISVSLLI